MGSTGTALVHRIAWQRGERHDLHGMAVLIAPDFVATEEHLDPKLTRQRVLENVDLALRAISVLDPHRFARLRRDVRGIVVWPATIAVAYFEDRNRFCVLNTEYVRTRNALMVALLIVHEGVHARLRSIPYDESTQLRIEYLCMKAELHFAQRVPDTTELRATLAERLRSVRDVVPTEEEYVRDGLAKLRAVGLGERWVRLLARLRGFPER